MWHPSWLEPQFPRATGGSPTHKIMGTCGVTRPKLLGVCKMSILGKYMLGAFYLNVYPLVIVGQRKIPFRNRLHIIYSMYIIYYLYIYIYIFPFKCQYMYIILYICILYIYIYMYIKYICIYSDIVNLANI